MLVKNTIKQGFIGAFGHSDKAERSARTSDFPDAKQPIRSTGVAEATAQTVIDAIKSMTITYTSGLVSPTGPVTGTFKCTIR